MFAKAAARSFRRGASSLLISGQRKQRMPTLQQLQSFSSSPKQQQQKQEGGPDGVEDSNKPLAEKGDKSWMARLWDTYSVRHQTNRIIVAEAFLQAANKQASDPRWFGPGRITRDFRSHQALVTMHVWFLHKRLISNTSDPHTAALIQEELFDIFWTDTTCRMRNYGVNEWLIQKNLKTVQQYTFMHCFHYDHCYTDLLDKPEERHEELRNLIARHVLLLNPDGEPANAPSAQAQLDAENKINFDQLERLVWYVEAQYQNIVHDIPEQLYRDGRVAWVNLPDFSKLLDNDGKQLDEVPIDTDDVLPHPWARNIANDGQYYYWNMETRKSTWERPVA